MHTFQFETLIPLMEIIGDQWDPEGTVKHNNSLSHMMKQIDVFYNRKLNEEVEAYLNWEGDLKSWKYRLMSTIFPIAGKGYGGVNSNEFSTKYLRDTYVAYVTLVETVSDPIYTLNHRAIDEIDMTEILLAITSEMGNDFKEEDGFSNVIIYFNMKKNEDEVWPFFNGIGKPNYYDYEDEENLNEPVIAFGKLNNVYDKGAISTYGKVADSLGFDFDKSFKNKTPFIKGIIFDIDDYMLWGKGGDGQLIIGPATGSPAFYIGNQMMDDLFSIGQREKFLRIPFHIIVMGESVLAGGGGGGGTGNVDMPDMYNTGGGGRPYGYPRGTWMEAGRGKTMPVTVEGPSGIGGDGGDLGEKGWDGSEGAGAAAGKCIVYDGNPKAGSPRPAEFDVTIHYHHELDLKTTLIGEVGGDVKVVPFNPVKDVPF